MDTNTIRLGKPYISEGAIQELNEVLRSGNLVQGNYVSKFETALSKYLECEHVVVVSSGTAALHLALIAAGIKHGDEVIVPAFTFPATANVIEIVGATPIMVDIQLDDFCIDVTQIEKAITSRTKAILPVHEFGQAADMGAIMDIAKSRNLIVIEDAACGLGTEFNGKKVGTFGKMGCLSFHPRKAITTGEGGAIITNDAGIANTLRSLRNHGVVHNAGKIDFEYVGFNYRLTDFQAVLGVYQLENFDKITETRQKQASYLNQVFENNANIATPNIFSNRRHTFQTYHILIHQNFDRDLVIKLLWKHGIETNYGAYALNALSFYQKKYKFTDSLFPNALKAYKHGLALPVGGHIDKTNIENMSIIFNKILNV